MGDGGAPVSLHVRRMTPPRFFCSIRLEINDSTVTTVIINQMAVARGAQGSAEIFEDPSKHQSTCPLTAMHTVV